MMSILQKLGLTEKIEGVSNIKQEKSAFDSIVEVVSPSSQDIIAIVEGCSKRDYGSLMTYSMSEFGKWQNIELSQRRELFEEIKEEILEKRIELSKLVSLETGKPIRESILEVQAVIEVIDLALAQSWLIHDQVLQSENNDYQFYKKWYPYGIIGIISSFNFPISVWAWTAFSALISGNVIIWKPSELTPLSAIVLNKICSLVCKKQKLPNVFNYFIPKNHDVTKLFLQDQRIPVISFTGSSKTGRYISKTVSERFGKTILELGGNNAVIVDKKVDLDLAITEIVKGAIGTSGQRCTSTRRVLVHKSHYDKVINGLIDKYKKINISDPFSKDCDMGPLISKNAVTLYLNTIDKIKLAKGVTEFGGKGINRKGHYVEPTIVTGINNNDDIVQKETFAPILYIIPFNNFDDAIKMQNSAPQGLTSALFSKNNENINKFLSLNGSDCGMANVNTGTTTVNICLPFGGEKETGGGRVIGLYSWQQYMRQQSNVVKKGVKS